MHAGRTALTIASLCLLLAACSDIFKPPSEIVEPRVVGLWEADTRLDNGDTRMSLTNGESFDIHETRDQLAMAFVGNVGPGTLLLYGEGPNGRWWIRTERAPEGDDPPDCYRIGPNVYAYAEPNTVVFRARSDSGEAKFGIRIPIAVGVALPTAPPDHFPAYDSIQLFCLNERGEVTNAR